MAKKKGKRVIIRMVAQDGSGHFYTTHKNQHNSREKLELNKYNPVARKKMPYKEEKIK